MESIYNYIYCCLDKPTDILRPVGSVCRDIHILLIFCYVLRSRSMPVKTTLKSDFFFISCVREVGMSKSPLIRLFVLQWSILVFIWYLLKKKKSYFCYVLRSRSIHVKKALKSDFLCLNEVVMVHIWYLYKCKFIFVMFCVQNGPEIRP